MPLMMEEGIDVDDLFGDPTSLELGLSAPHPPKGLAQRLDEMRLLGCCQKLAWSRLGCLAYISQDGYRINVRHLLCRPSDGKWVLSEDTQSHTVADGPGNHALVHLEWSETGSELAVVDAGGRVAIFSISTALNNIVLHRQATLDQADDGAQVVGMLWLNTQRSIHAFHQAAKLNGRWGYSPFRRRPIGPFNPFSKTALLCVTRSGLLRFLYQYPDSKWAEISTELKVTNHSDRLLTHAALVPTSAGILIAVHSACQKIYMSRVNINWTPNQWDPNQARQGAGSHNIPTPSFIILYTKIEHPNSILSSKNNASDNTENFSPGLTSTYSLTQLDIIPGQPDSTNNSASGPWVLAVYSNSAHPGGADPQQQTAASVIVRWQFETSSLTLHPKFDELESRKNISQVKPKMELRRLEDLYSERSVVSVDHIEFGNVLAVTYDDSSIAFLDPKTMVSFNGVDDTNTVTSMAQAGFHYPLEASGLHVAFSPTGCLAVVLDSDWQMRLRTMEHSFGSEEGLYDESKFSAAVAALALAFCRGCGSDINTDDILLIILRQLTSDAQNVFINEVYRALPINCDFTAEQDKLMNHPYIPRCLSIQAALGFKNYYTSRSLPSSVSWAILHLRHASVLYAFFYQYNKGAKDAEPHDADVLRMILGNTKWVLAFYHFIVDELFGLADEFKPVFSDPEAFAQKVKSTNSLALTLLLSSMSRAFLRFICRGLRGVHAAFPTAPAAGEARIYYKELCDSMEVAPIKVEIFEKFLAGVDSAVRHAYQGAGFGDNERPAPEKELLVNSRIPAVLVSAVATVLRQTLPSLAEEIDRLATYVGDYSWVGFGSDKRTELYRRTHEVDVVKKIPLRRVFSTQQSKSTGQQNGSGTATISFLKGSKSSQSGGGRTRRRCVRCCEVSGDVGPPRSFLWLRMIVKLGLLRSCLCGGMWALDSNNNPWETDPATTGHSNSQAAGNRVDNTNGGNIDGTASILAGVS